MAWCSKASCRRTDLVRYYEKANVCNDSGVQLYRNVRTLKKS
ncbi:hypothetical protein S250808_131 [Synechococcus phage S-CAM3]|uniref:Uncharacterized protein n=1 Tax=Synechococcus phage S-CAM3 TaxID=1883366 RepID=A0A1D8KJ03_9CAUD|nr:hypothetical protein S250808_131 [Synechococcus phage S-CAM3]